MGENFNIINFAKSLSTEKLLDSKIKIHQQFSKNILYNYLKLAGFLHLIPFIVGGIISELLCLEREDRIYQHGFVMLNISCMESAENLLVEARRN